MINFKEKNILIYGFGITGKSCFNFLDKKNNIKIYDDNISNIPKKFFKFYLIKKKITPLVFDFIILSPGIDKRNCSLKNYLKRYNSKIITDLDIFYKKFLNNTKITVTGTNGKSTTVKLLYEVFKKAKKDVRLIGNIGKPVLNEKKVNDNTIFIIEASSYQLEYSKFFKTNISVILNLSPDHLERHKTFSSYINSKFKLIKNQDKKGIAFFQKGDKILEKKILILKKKIKIYRVNLNIEYDILSKFNNEYLNYGVNRDNFIFVYKISKFFNLEDKKIINAANNFKSLPYRQQIIYKNRFFTIINDSKSTSFSSSHNLLKKYKNNYWLVGGIAKKGDKFILKKRYIKSTKAYIFGKNSKKFIKQLKNKMLIKKFKNINDAINTIFKDINKKKHFNIIFSPAGASFDQFRNFEKRGEYFNQLIKKKLNNLKNGK